MHMVHRLMIIFQAYPHLIYGPPSMLGYVCLVTGLHGSTLYLSASAGYATFSLRGSINRSTTV